MNTARPIIKAEVTFLPESEGGRKTKPFLTQNYMPHIVIQSHDSHEAIVDNNKISQEEYLGICFLEATTDYSFGETINVTLDLMYHPRVDYRAMQSDATFTIREGGKIVGHGRVIERNEAEH